MKIVVVSGTVREGRESHKVAQLISNKINNSNQATAEIVDVKAYNLPLLEYTFGNHPNPTKEMQQLQQVFAAADGFVLVSPEYNGGMPGALKNTLDYFHKEYREKSFAVCSVSSGGRAGLRVAMELRTQAVNYGGYLLPRMLNVANVSSLFDGEACISTKFSEEVDTFVSKLTWLTEALINQKNK